MRQRRQAYLVGIHDESRIEVPDDPEGERRAAADSPELKRLLSASRRRRGQGRNGASLEDVMARYGVAPQGTTTSSKRPTGRRPAGDSGNVRVRMPKRLHRELAEQAEREGVSLNTLIVTYLAREAGVRTVLSELA